MVALHVGQHIEDDAAIDGRLDVSARLPCAADWNVVSLILAIAILDPAPLPEARRGCACRPSSCMVSASARSSRYGISKFWEERGGDR